MPYIAYALAIVNSTDNDIDKIIILSMRKSLSIMGLVVLWGFVVVIFFMAEEKLVGLPAQKGDLTSFENYVVQRFNNLREQKKIGSAGFALIQSGRLKAEHGFGVANIETQTQVKPDQTLYLLSSLSKAVTTWGVMRLVQEGKLGLDDAVMSHLKRWQFPGSETYGDKVTVRHLLSHTAGFVDGYGHSGFLKSEELQTIEESLQLPKDANMGIAHAAILEFEPGTAMSYSSAGYDVLQLIIEEITGKTFNDYMKEAVLEPLGMFKSDYDLKAIISEGRVDALATNYDLDLNPNPYRFYTNMAGVSLRSTVHDLAILVMAYCNENPVLTQESLKQLSLPQPGTSFRWGLGHTLYGENNSGGYVFGHGGGSFPASGAEIRLNADTGNGIVIVGSGSQGVISEIGDAWTYWETGRRKFDFRNVVHKRKAHALVAFIIGMLLIIVWQKKKQRLYKEQT